MTDYKPDKRVHGHDAGATLTKTQAAEVREQLALILNSKYFHTSQRASTFLEYSVHYVLDSRPFEEMKERIIGTEAFQRAADYDTAQDNIVRVTANEVRKRLALYYGNLPGTPSLTLHLSPGSYAVGFHWAAENSLAQVPEPGVSELRATPSEPPSERTHRSRASIQVAMACMLVLVSLVTVIAYRTSHAANLVQMVWSPVLQSKKSALICIAQPLAYGPTSDSVITAVPNGKPVPLTYAFFAIGDTFALVDTVKVLSEHGKSWQLLPGNSTPSAALLAGPVIIFGNRTNKWSREMIESQRFFFDVREDAIYDRSRPQVKWALTNKADDWSATEDYAIVSRFTNPASGEPVIAIAGFTMYGTQAAGDFITNQELLKMAMQDAPKDWEKRNFQFVLHVKVIGNTPERPTVIASNFS